LQGLLLLYQGREHADRHIKLSRVNAHGSSNPLQVFPKLFLAISFAIPITYFIDINRVVHRLKIIPIINFQGRNRDFYSLQLFAFPYLGVKFLSFH
jgi:hypothetical protein